MPAARTVVLISCSALCVLGALLLPEHPRLGQFLPLEREAHVEIYEDATPRVYEAATSETTELDRSLVRGKLESLVADIEAFHERNGRLPDDLAELIGAGSEADGTALIPEGTWRVPMDPWDEAYRLEFFDGGRFEVRSLGPDGEPQTEDDLVSEGHVEAG